MSITAQEFARDIFNHARKLLTIILVLAALASVLAHEEPSTTIIVLACIFSILLAVDYYIGFGTANAQASGEITSLLPAAIALELILYMWARTVMFAQIAVTFSVALVLYTAKRVKEGGQDDDIDDWLKPYWEDAKRTRAYVWEQDSGHVGRTISASLRMIWKRKFNILYVDKDGKLAWITVRTLILILSQASGIEELWLVAQLILLVGILAFATDAFPDNTSKRTAILAAAATIGVAMVLYTIDGVLPWGLSVIVMVTPVYYIVNQSIPNGFGEREDAHIRAITAVVAVVCVAIAFAWPHTYDSGKCTETHPYAYSSDSMCCQHPVTDYGCTGTSITCPAHTCIDYATSGTRNFAGPVAVYDDASGSVYSTRCPKIHGLRECNHNPHGVTIGQCCCEKGKVPFHEGCMPKICYSSVSRSHQTTRPRDCCSHAIPQNTDHLMCGSHLCLCSNTPTQTLNRIHDGKCECAEGYSGTCCEYKSTGVASNENVDTETFGFSYRGTEVLTYG